MTPKGEVGDATLAAVDAVVADSRKQGRRTVILGNEVAQALVSELRVTRRALEMLDACHGGEYGSQEYWISEARKEQQP